MYTRLLLLSLLFIPFVASAQSLGEIGTSDPFSISVTPQYPAPYSDVRITPMSGALDLTGATIIASVSGKEIYRGNARFFTVTLGRAGSPTTIKVTATSGGLNYIGTVTVMPQDVALVVEPISYAPPLYAGKPLIPLEGKVRMVAVASLRTPSGAAIDPIKNSYLWTIDGVRMATLSGVGKMTALVDAPLQYRTRSVDVVVTSADLSLVGGATVTLSGYEPSIRIYENDPLLGIRFDRAVAGSYTLTGAEASLYAVPFSFPISNDNPLIEWFLNGALAQTGNSITFRPTGSGQGSASLSLVASSNDATKVFTQLSLSFGANSGFNLFGL